MGEVIYDPSLAEKVEVYKDRRHAGRALGSFMKSRSLVPDLIMAVPAGGVPVALEAAKVLGVKMDIIIVKKVLYPWTTEAGFGAVGPLGTAVIGPSPLSEEEVEVQLSQALEKVKERERVLRRGKPYPDLTDLTVAIMDDGIATGYTMLTAVEAVRKMGAREVWAAAPTGSVEGAERVARKADLVIVPNLRSGPYFAVADAYETWYDLDEEEVLRLLEEAKNLGLLL